MPRAGSLTHGASAWRTKRCTCDACRLASRALAQKNARERAARLAADPTVVPHGEFNTYVNWGCRCILCGAARRRYFGYGERVNGNNGRGKLSLLRGSGHSGAVSRSMQ